jgi:type IV secretory pathway VirB4 component
VVRAWTHWATSEDWWPLRVPSHDAGTGIDGRPLGRAVRGTAFVFDPFDAYQKSLTTNPNMVVAGGIGMGKSTLVKMLIDRSLERGRRVVIVDPKGEYGPLAALYATTPVVLGRDGWCNPFGPTNHEHRTLVRTMVSSAQATPLTPEQHYVLDEAWRALEGPTPPRVLRALYDVVRGALAVSAPSPERDIALVLRRFITGDLAGLFDGDGPSLDFGEQLVVLDLSQQWASASLAMAALSAISAAQQVAPGPAEQGFVIIDEAWALLADPYALRWLQGSWKLARARGVSHVLVLHRWTDVGAVGDEGSANRARAQGLLRECETVWLFRQLHEELEEMGEALGLRVEERRALAHLRKGQVLVRYGTARSVVNLEPDERDQVFIDTDAAMRGKGGS